MNTAANGSTPETTAPACAVTPCTKTVFMEHPLPLCKQHAVQVSLHVTDTLYAAALNVGGTHTLNGDEEASALIAAADVASSSVWERTSHQPVVYFIANGDRVKIGTSTNIRGRISSLALRRENVLLMLDGGYDLEKALHRNFSGDRIGTTEWFVLSHGIRQMIRDKKSALLVAIPNVPEKAKTVSIRSTIPSTANGVVDPRREHVRQFLRTSQPNGVPTSLIFAELSATYGDDWNRSVVTTWLSDDVRAGRIARPRKGVYAWVAETEQ